MSKDRGIFAALGAAVLFGLSTPFAKLLLGNTSPLMLAGMLYLGSGTGLAILLLLRAVAGQSANMSWPRGAELLWLLGAIVIGGGFGPYLLMRGLESTDSASASLILNLEAVLTATMAWFVFHENFDRRIAIGMALIVAGGVILTLGSGFRASGLAGPLAIAGACLAWAIDNNLIRKVAIHDAMSIACAKGLVAGSTSIILAVANGAQWPPMHVVFQITLLGFVGYGLSLTLFVVALRRLGTARTGAYFSLAPFIGAAMALSLGAPFSIALAIAGLLMGAGVWLHLSEEHEHRHFHSRMEHDHEHQHDEHHKHAHPEGWSGREPHSHWHEHEPLEHAHPHYPDAHHRHEH